MTQNQIAYQRLQEEQRANKVKEAEQERSNKEQERATRERDRTRTFLDTWKTILGVF